MTTSPTPPSAPDDVAMKRGDFYRMSAILKTMAMQKTIRELKDHYGDDEYEGDTEYAYDWFCQHSREALSILESAIGEKK